MQMNASPSTRPYLTKGESRRRTCGGSGGGGRRRGEVPGCVYTWGRGSCLRAAQPHHGDGLPRLSRRQAAGLSAAALMEIRGDSACSEGEAGNVYVLDEEAAGSGPEAVEQLDVIHNRADSENAASA